MAGDWNDALRRARNEAPFLARALARQGPLAEFLAQGDGPGALAWAKAAGADDADVGIALRKERLALATALAIGDLAGAFPLAQVMGELSDFADRALDAAIYDAIRQRLPDADFGDSGPAGFIGLALGKQGAGELNYSSDIDPILLFDPETLPRRVSDEPGEAAQRYARHIVRTLSENTAYGYVFRVDLRLRPASEISPLAVPIPSALAHYQGSALAWERAAFIRARAAAGDIAAGEAFLHEIDPFVWRSALDFGAVEEVRQLTCKIRDNHDGPIVPGPGFDLKQGRGGIREIEFFAQTHQLIHGGRDLEIRLRGTRESLDALAQVGRISSAQADMLGTAYDRLRVLEHRVQMVNDRQTHALPAGDALDSLARLDGMADGAELLEELTALTEEVANCYDTLIDTTEEICPSEAENETANTEDLAQEPTLESELHRLGFSHPKRLATRITGWSDGRYQSLRSEAALEAFDAMLPLLLDALGNAADPDRALARWESVLDNASSAVNLFRLLEARPELLDQLIAILTLAPTLADELGQRPALLDTLIDGSALELPGTIAELVEEMQVPTVPDEEREKGFEPDYEDALNRIRQVTSETRFALGLQLVERVHDPLDISAGMSRLAEAGMQVALDAAAHEFARKYGHVTGAELLILGLGRLGGGMLTHASDLDIVYLFTGPFNAKSEGQLEGQRSLSASNYFNRLAQRVTAALSVPTAQGALYEVDTRLRPQGAQGPLVVTVSNFAKYQAQTAWSWEHMALTRARVLVGSEEASRDLGDKIADVLCQSRDVPTLRKDVLAMRRDISVHKKPVGPLDVKLLRGGLMDIEFCVHFLQLSNGVGLKPQVRAAIDALADAGLVDEHLAKHWRFMTRILISARLLAPHLGEPPPVAAAALAKACGCENFPALLHQLDKARNGVAKNWQTAFGKVLEI